MVKTVRMSRMEPKIRTRTPVRMMARTVSRTVEVVRTAGAARAAR